MSIKSELLALLLTLIVTLAAGPILQRLDPAAGSLDISFLQLLTFGWLRALSCLALLWLSLHVAFKTVAKHIDGGEWSRDFERLTVTHRTWLTVVVLLALLALSAWSVLGV